MSVKEADPSAKLNCSFCGKRESQVSNLIAGPSVFICEKCIALGAKIIAEGNKAWREKLIAKLSGLT